MSFSNLSSSLIIILSLVACSISTPTYKIVLFLYNFDINKEWVIKNIKIYKKK